MKTLNQINREYGIIEECRNCRNEEICKINHLDALPRAQFSDKIDKKLTKAIKETKITHHCNQCHKQLTEMYFDHEELIDVSHRAYVCYNPRCPNFGLLTLSVEQMK